MPGPHFPVFLWWWQTWLHSGDTHSIPPADRGLPGCRSPPSAKRRCPCGSGAPLGFTHTRRHPGLPGKNVFNLFSTCICPASIWKLVLHVGRTEEPLAKFCSSRNCCDQSWHPSFHREVVQARRVENFLILPGQKLSTSKLSALPPSAVRPHDSRVWQARQLCTSSSPLTHIWQKELVSQAHKENQLKKSKWPFCPRTQVFSSH